MCFTLVYSAEKDRLAVMDVTDETGMLDEKTIINVTDYIFTKFQGTGSFWMIPKSDRDTALDKAIEETKLNSRKECVDEKCQLSLVAELQANFLINTKIKKLYEGTCNITISKFDVEKRAGVFSWDKRFDCSSKGMFDAIDGFNFKNLDESVEKTKKQVVYQWSKRSSEKLSWSESKSYCENLKENEYDDWRLPTISELRELVKNCPYTESNGTCKVSDKCLDNKTCSDSYCDGCPYKTNGNYSKQDDVEGLWSVSELEDGSVNAWRIDFSHAEIDHDYRSSKNFVRCVRWRS